MNSLTYAPNAILVVLLNVLFPLFLSVYFLAVWNLYRKAGYNGGIAFVPFYRIWVRYQFVYGNGWKCLWLLVPFYGIFVAIRYRFDFARAFGRTREFGVGLLLLPHITVCIMAFARSIKYEGCVEYVYAQEEAT